MSVHLGDSHMGVEAYMNEALQITEDGILLEYNSAL
jgi:hypothetical protein